MSGIRKSSDNKLKKTGDQIRKILKKIPENLDPEVELEWWPFHR